MDHLKHHYSSPDRKDEDHMFREIFDRLLKESQTNQRTEQSLQHHAHETTQTTSRHDLREKSRRDVSEELDVSRQRGHRDDYGHSSRRFKTEKYDELDERSLRKDYALSSHKRNPEMLYASTSRERSHRDDISHSSRQKSEEIDILRRRNYEDDSELEKGAVSQELERGRSDDRHHSHRKREFEKHERSRKRTHRNSDSDQSDTIEKRRLSSPDIFSKRIHKKPSSKRDSLDNLSFKSNDLREKLNKSSSIYCADRSENLSSHQRDSEQYDRLEYLKQRQSDYSLPVDERFYDYSRRSTQREGDEHKRRRMSRSEKILRSPSREYKDSHRRDRYDSDSEIDSPRSIDKMKRHAPEKRRQRERPYGMMDSTSSDSPSPRRESQSRSYRKTDSTRTLQDDFYREYEQSRLYGDRDRAYKSGRKDQHERSADPYGLRQMDEITLLKEKLKLMQSQGISTDKEIDKLAGVTHSSHRREITYPEEDDNVSRSSRISGSRYDELQDSIKKRASASARRSFSPQGFKEKSHQERAREHYDKSGSPVDTDPVVVLSELRAGVKYELLCEFGDSTNKLYTMQVTVDKQTFIGTGKSKDIAKVEAAKLALKEKFNLDCKDKVPSSLKKLRDDYEMAKRSKHIEDDEVYEKITPRTRKRSRELIGSETKSKHRKISPERDIPSRKISLEREISSRRISSERDFPSRSETVEQQSKIKPPSKQYYTHVEDELKQTTYPSNHNQIPVHSDKSQIPVAINHDHSSSIDSNRPPQAVENIPQQAQLPLEMNYSYMSSIGSSAPPQAVENVPQQIQLPLEINYSHVSSISSSAQPQTVEPQQMPFSHQVMATESFDQNTAPVYPQYPGSQIIPPQSFNQSIYATQPYMYGTSASVTQTYTQQLNAPVQPQIPPAYTYPPPMVPPQPVYNQINPQPQYPLLPPYQVSYPTNQATTAQPFSYQSNISIPPPTTSQMGVQPATNVHYQTEVSSIKQIRPNNTAQSKMSAGGTSNSSDAKKQEPEKMVNALEIVAEEELDKDIRPVFPEAGMACNVSGCQTPVFTSFNHLRKHWVSRHSPLIIKYQCELCKYKHVRRNQLQRHYRDIHHLSENEIQEKMSKNTGVNTTNFLFMDPGQAVMPEFIWKLDKEVFCRAPLSDFNKTKTGGINTSLWLVRMIETVKNCKISPVPRILLTRFMFPQQTEEMVTKYDFKTQQFLKECDSVFCVRDDKVILRERFLNLKWNKEVLSSKKGENKSEPAVKVVWKLRTRVFDWPPLSLYKTADGIKIKWLVKVVEMVKNSDVKPVSCENLTRLILPKCTEAVQKAAIKDIRIFLHRHRLLFIIDRNNVTLKELNLKWYMEPEKTLPSSSNSAAAEIFPFLSSDVKNEIEKGKNKPEPAAKVVWKLNTSMFDMKPLTLYKTSDGTKLKWLVNVLEMVKNSNIQPVSYERLSRLMLPECTEAVQKAALKDIRMFLNNYKLLFMSSGDNVILKETLLKWYMKSEKTLPSSSNSAAVEIFPYLSSDVQNEIEKNKNKTEPEFIWRVNTTVFDDPPLSTYRKKDIGYTQLLVYFCEKAKNCNMKPIPLSRLIELVLSECTGKMERFAQKNFKEIIAQHELLFNLQNGMVTLKENYLKWTKVIKTGSTVKKDKNSTEPEFMWRLNRAVLENREVKHYTCSGKGFSNTELVVRLLEKLKNFNTKPVSISLLVENTGPLKGLTSKDILNIMSQRELFFIVQNDMVILREKFLKWTKVPKPKEMVEKVKDKMQPASKPQWKLQKNVFTEGPPVLKKIDHINTLLLSLLLEKLKNCTNQCLCCDTLYESILPECTAEMKETLGKSMSDYLRKYDMFFEISNQTIIKNEKQLISKQTVTLKEKHLKWVKIEESTVTPTASVIKDSKDEVKDKMQPASKPQWKLQKNVFTEGPPVLKKIDHTNTLLLSLLLEKVKNWSNQRMNRDALYKSILPECTAEIKKALGKSLSDYLRKYDMLFTLTKRRVTLKEEHLRWVKIEESTVTPTASVIKDSKDEKEEVLTGKWILDRCSLMTSVVKILRDETDLKILVESLEILKNNNGFYYPSNLCEHLNKVLVSNPASGEMLFKTWNHYVEFVSHFPLLIEVVGDNMKLIDKQLKWKLESKNEEETGNLSLMDLKRQHDLKDSLDRWVIEKRKSYFPDAYLELAQDGSRDLLILILQELKCIGASAYLPKLVYSVNTNPWFTTEMKKAVGGQFNARFVKTFLSKFPTLVLLGGHTVQAFLKDNFFHWLYFPGQKLFSTSKSPLETQCDALLYFRNIILNENRKRSLTWLSFVTLSLFVKSAPDQVKTCVGEMQACWLPWLFNHPCIFQFDANHKLFALRETVISDFDEPSVSMYHKDYYVLMYIKGLIERKNCSLSLDDLFKGYCLNVDSEDREKYHSQQLPVYTHDEFVEFVRVNGESFFTVSEGVISVRHPLPVVFISGIYPYDGCEKKYIGHGKVKQVCDSYAIIDVGRNCSENVYFDKNLFKSEIKPLSSCIKIGDWFSFSAVQVEGLKCVDIKQNSKWKASSLWTAKMTFKQLEQSFNINENDASTSDIMNRDLPLDKSNVSSIANSENKTESMQDVVSNCEKEPNNKPSTQQEVIKILSDDESQDSDKNTDKEKFLIGKSADTSDNMAENSKTAQGSKDSQIDNLTILAEKRLSSDCNKEFKYEAMNTEDTVGDNSNENKSSESLDQCKIVDKTGDDISMVTDAHSNVIEGNQVMVYKNNNLTSEMEEKSPNSHLIEVNSGTNENEMSEGLELSKVVDETKADLLMVSETCSSSSEEKKKKKIVTTKKEQKSSNSLEDNSKINENKSSEDLEQCKIAHNNEEDMSMVTESHGSVTDENQVIMDNKNNNSTSEMEESTPSIVEDHSGINENEIPQSSELCEGVDICKTEYEPITTRNSIILEDSLNINENKSSEDLDRCKIIDNTKDDASMVTGAHSIVTEEKLVMVKNNKNLTSDTKEQSSSTPSIVEGHSGMNENDLSESLELCKVVDKTKDDSPMVSETHNSVSEEKKKKKIVKKKTPSKKIEQKSLNADSHNPSTDDTDYVMSNVISQQIKQDDGSVVKEESQGVPLVSQRNVNVKSDLNLKESELSENTDLSKIIEKIDADSTVTCEISCTVMNDDKMVEEVERNSAIAFAPIKQAVDQGTQTIISGEIVAKEDLPLSVIKSLFS